MGKGVSREPRSRLLPFLRSERVMGGAIAVAGVLSTPIGIPLLDECDCDEPRGRIRADLRVRRRAVASRFDHEGPRSQQRLSVLSRALAV
jgi:hypothetical protein